MIADCTGVILAGGENRRMPYPKAFIKIGKESIIERNLKIMGFLFKEVFIITNQPEAYFSFGMPMYGDIYNIRGPMTGILTSLINSRSKRVFVSACDMPFINQELIQYMSSKGNGYEAVVPKYNGKVEPLFAFYSKSMINSIEDALLRDNRGLHDFLRHKKVKYTTAKEIKRIDPQGRSFINLNTPEDVAFYLHQRAA